jgi:hypothetical protein
MSELKAETLKEVKKQAPQPEDLVYVTIPETDIFDAQHPTVQLNSHKFEAGKTYQVPAVVGAEIEDRLKKFHKECVRLLRPKADMKSINQVNAGSLWAKNSAFSMENEDGLNAHLSPGEKVITVKW